MPRTETTVIVVTPSEGLDGKREKKLTGVYLPPNVSNVETVEGDTVSEVLAGLAKITKERQ